MRIPLLSMLRRTPEVPPDDADVEHIIGWLEGWVSAFLNRVPRALCGVPLLRNPDHPEWPTPNAPDCPRCVAIKTTPLFS